MCLYCYSYDTRGLHSAVPKHWQDGNLETRAFFRTMMEPSTLSIDNISEKDEGEYRCRIDYLRSSTKNLRVKLGIIGEWRISSFFELEIQVTKLITH